jgi:hypothetical protein
VTWPNELKWNSALPLLMWLGRHVAFSWVTKSPRPRVQTRGRDSGELGCPQPNDLHTSSTEGFERARRNLKDNSTVWTALDAMESTYLDA